MVDEVVPDEADATDADATDAYERDDQDTRSRTLTVLTIIVLLVIIWLHRGCASNFGAPSGSSSSIEIPLASDQDTIPPVIEPGSPDSYYETDGVPDVIGMTRPEAVDTIHGAGYEAAVLEVYGITHPAGRVFYQSPSPGSQLEPGGLMRVTLQKRERPVVRVPGLVGLSQSAAEDRIEAVGFKPVLSYRPGDKKVGRIFSQWPREGEWLVEGGDVQIQVTIEP